jgi:hypothetical protein
LLKTKGHSDDTFQTQKGIIISMRLDTTNSPAWIFNT